MSKIIKNTCNTDFCECDSLLIFDDAEAAEKIKLLQITDMQFIDSTQARSPDRLREDEITAWKPENFNILCANQIKSLLAQTKPDMIFITGDMVYGEFDDSGRTFEWFCNFMESLSIPWAPVFGNHDNETKRGVDWQCKMLEGCANCLFKRGNVSGNSNYSLGIVKGGKLIRVMHMIDTNGCKSDSPSIKARGIYDDQIERICKHAELIKKQHGKNIPSFLTYHIPTEDFEECARVKGYIKGDIRKFNIGVDVEAQDGDFGYYDENKAFIKTSEAFKSMLKIANVDGIFVGHLHKVNTCITLNGIKRVFGLKTGQYDYHVIGQNGGTLVTLYGSDFEVQHIPALTRLAPYPADAPVIKEILTF